MSATRTILLGTAFGLVAGAATLAQSTDGPTASTDLDIGTDAGTALEAPMDGTPEIDGATDTTAEAGSAAAQDAPLMASAEELIGARVYDINEEWVGEVSELLPADATGEDRVVIEIGGFLGIGETPVAVDADAITIAWTDAGAVDYATVAMSEAELERIAASDS